MKTSFDNFPVNVGTRLRELRIERNTSMRSLSRESGLSTNALSMIERNLVSPSVSTLYKIAGALGVPVSAFFRVDPQRKNIVFSKADEHNRISFLRGIWEGLGGEKFLGGVEPFILTLEPGGNSGKFTMAHSGQEFVLCLEGEIEYEVETERFLLEKGDNLIFNSNLRHRWRNPGKKISKVLIIISGFQIGEHPSEFHLQNKIEMSDE